MVWARPVREPWAGHGEHRNSFQRQGHFWRLKTRGGNGEPSGALPARRKPGMSGFSGCRAEQSDREPKAAPFVPSVLRS